MTPSVGSDLRSTGAIMAETFSGSQSLIRGPDNRWTAGTITVTTEPTPGALRQGILGGSVLAKGVPEDDRAVALRLAR